MTEKHLEGAHLSTMPDTAGGHAMAQTVQRDVGQAETVNERTVSGVKAGGRDAVDVAGELPFMA